LRYHAWLYRTLDGAIKRYTVGKRKREKVAKVLYRVEVLFVRCTLYRARNVHRTIDVITFRKFIGPTRLEALRSNVTFLGRFSIREAENGLFYFRDKQGAFDRSS